MNLRVLAAGIVLLVAVLLKFLGVHLAVVGILGFCSMIVLLISSFKSVFLLPKDEMCD
jgi:uncharacterized membrane protein